MRNMATTANKSPNLKNRRICFMCVSVICQSFFFFFINSLLQLATAQRALRRHELSRMARARRRRRSPGLLLQQLRVVRGEELHSEPQDGVFGSCAAPGRMQQGRQQHQRRSQMKGVQRNAAIAAVEVGRRGGGGGGA